MGGEEGDGIAGAGGGKDTEDESRSDNECVIMEMISARLGRSSSDFYFSSVKV